MTNVINGFVPIEDKEVSSVKKAPLFDSAPDGRVSSVAIDIMEGIELPSIEEIKKSQSPNFARARITSSTIDIMEGIELPEIESLESPNTVATDLYNSSKDTLNEQSGLERIVSGVDRKARLLLHRKNFKKTKKRNLVIKTDSIISAPASPNLKKANPLEIKNSHSDLQEWKLFSDPEFKIDGVSSIELQKIKDYVSENYIYWEASEHIIPNQSGLERAIDFVGGKAYLLFNRNKKMGDKKEKGAMKIVCDAICLNDGTKHASASLSFGKSYYNNVNSFVSEINKEIEKMEIFEGDSRFIQLENFIEYKDKKGSYKARMIMPHFENNLHTALRKKVSYPFNSSEKLDIASQIVDFVQEAHRRGFVLKDLKAKNILIRKENDKWKIACCDLEQFCERNSPSAHEMGGTAIYRSPDLLINRVATEATDVWALGIVLASIFGEYEEEINNALSKEETIKNLKSDWIKKPPKNSKMKHLIWRMLQVDPKDRISSEDALKEIKLLNLHDQTY